MPYEKRRISQWIFWFNREDIKVLKEEKICDHCHEKEPMWFAFMIYGNMNKERGTLSYDAFCEECANFKANSASKAINPEKEVIDLKEFMEEDLSGVRNF